MNDRLASGHISDAHPVLGRVSAICVLLGRLSYARRLENVQMSPGNGGSVRIAPGNGTSVQIAPEKPRARGASGGPVRAMRRNERRWIHLTQQAPCYEYLENVRHRGLLAEYVVEAKMSLGKCCLSGSLSFSLTPSISRSVRWTEATLGDGCLLMKPWLQASSCQGAVDSLCSRTTAFGMNCQAQRNAA